MAATRRGHNPRGWRQRAIGFETDMRVLARGDIMEMLTDEQANRRGYQSGMGTFASMPTNPYSIRTRAGKYSHRPIRPDEGDLYYATDRNSLLIWSE